MLLREEYEKDNGQSAYCDSADSEPAVDLGFGLDFHLLLRKQSITSIAPPPRRGHGIQLGSWS